MKPLLRAIWLLLMLGLASLAPGAEGVQPYWPQAQSLFPEAQDLGPLQGTPPSAPVLGASGVLGYVVLTNDVLRIPGYSGKPINVLVGMDTQGAIRGIRVVQHQEPILLVGFTEKDLRNFTDQYAGKKVTDQVRVGGRPAPGQPVIDAMTGATITVMVINRVVNEAVRKVALARGLINKHTGGLQPLNSEPIWRETWRSRGVDIAVLAGGLSVLVLILLFQDSLARHPTLLTRLRRAYLLYTVFFIGLYGMAQLSIVNVLTFVQSLLRDFKWESFLIDPMMFLLWSFVAVVLLLWGRGVYCGWLCPFGALQELLFQLAQRLRIPQWDPPQVVHERLWAIKYIVLIALFGLSLQSMGEAERYAEIEPFKTVFSLHLMRDADFVVYALALLAVGLFIRKAYCRYLCPLGAALTFPGRFRIFDWLRRRRECGRPCQICARECEVQAIRPTGEIIDNECHYCLDCQVTYWNRHVCPPLVEKHRKRALRERLSGDGEP